VSEGSPTERFGPYIVYEQLGIGGMAQVHRAVAADSDVQRPVALKRMLSHIAGSEDMVKSFVREARLASYLRHENVAQTYDLGRVGDTYFIVMELITGRNLREVLRHCGTTTGPMPVPVALNILNQICDALDYAHNLADETGQPLGIIHRDVSPSNVIVSTSGVVKLIDFGIAKASAAGMQTMSGTLKGKFAYMAPEYLAGQIDPRADLFAVGVIAHDLLTNRPLFSGRDDIDTLTRVRDMHIDPPSNKNPLVPAEIDDVVMTALARDPERRWQHATALRSALTTLTRRLGLIASNAQVIQWLDWAFAHKAPPRSGTDRDTETDRAPITDDEPSISISGNTVKLSSSNQMTLLMADGVPDPPTETPLGTPAYVPAQHPLPSGLAAAAAAERSSPVVAPRAAAAPVAPPKPRASTSIPVRNLAASTAPIAAAPPSRLAAPSQPPITHAAAHPPHRPPSPSQSQAPPIAAHPAAPSAAHPARPPHRPSSPSQSPPIAAHPAAHPPHRPASPSQPPPIAAQASPPAGHPAPMPQVPSFNPAPFSAPRPGRPSQVPAPAPGAGTPGYDPARSPQVAREFAQRASAPVHAPRYNPLVAVVLVILAAAAAATTVYFLLPLLT